eukprot:TRINITY_DN9416_c0_g1_i3.p1 TRINITY_DN9416_c0_g1~~TRINITY_DN9416_c0_g1_i3.p1  ORF type:complete len:1568 (+),score=233.26 TRINITY_DN9416_c0_g1_i3:51-4754(+)
MAPHCDDLQARSAAVEGFCVPEIEDDEQDDQAQQEHEALLVGDADKLTRAQHEIVLTLAESMLYPRIKIKRVALSFSGASVYFYTPMRSDGTVMPSSVLKLDMAECVRDEVIKTKQYAPLYGLATPQVKDVKYGDGEPNDPSSVMQIDLCGGIFGLPEFASASPVQTFAQVLEEKFKGSTEVDVIPLINEAFERRMHAFTMSSRKIKRVDLAGMYKLNRFVGHGVLHRAKEAKKRLVKSPALAAGFLNPPSIEELDPEGQFLLSLGGSRRTIEDYFQDFVGKEPQLQKMLDREVVCGLCHNDLHGGNLLLDTQGLVWLIDFATVKNDVHVLIDLSKFLASCLFMYLPDDVNEEPVRAIVKILATSPDATTGFPTRVGTGVINAGEDTTAAFLVDIVSRLRSCVCLYEAGDDIASSDGLPFTTALFSWSARMLSYSEPTLKQKARALYCALACAQRLLWQAGEDVGSTASSWIGESCASWKNEKAKSMLAISNQLQFSQLEFELELPRFLSQVGSNESWTTDFVTRERVHVADHCVEVAVNFQGRLFPRRRQLSARGKSSLKAFSPVLEKYLPSVLSLDSFFGRLMIIGDAGSGKSMLTRQLLSHAAERQVQGMYGDGESKDFGAYLIPVRVPLIDWHRMLEMEPEMSMEADPADDILSRWIARKYGDGSLPHQILQETRKACVVESTAGVAHIDRLIDGDRPRVVATDARLFLILDGLDEATSSKSQILGYLDSLLCSEPDHVVVITTRPNALDEADNKLLSMLSFHAFCMDQLSEQQASGLAVGILGRLGETGEKTRDITKVLLSPKLSVLRSTPLVLTLLVHIVRKYLSKAREDEKEKLLEENVFNKVDVFQRAIRLILHQSDAAKYLMRDGEGDKAMVRRLEMLKSPRARRFFERLAWIAHAKRVRDMSWEDIDEATDDSEITRAFREAFKAGRTPLFEKIDAATGEVRLQMSHLSFQELMAGEYVSAVANYSKKKESTPAFANYMLSNSVNQLDCERLSEKWWKQVWFNMSEMLERGVLDTWYDHLCDDERLRLKVGTTAYFYDYSPQKSQGMKSQTACPWDGWSYRVTKVDWENHTAVLKNTGDPCCGGIRRSEISNFHGGEKDRVNMGDVFFGAWGAAALQRAAVNDGYSEVLDALIQRRVHYACCDNELRTAFNQSMVRRDETMYKQLIAAKADAILYCGNIVMMQKFTHKLSERPFMQATAFFASHEEMRRAQPAGRAKAALDGTLDLGDATLSVNAADSQSGLSLLMLAAAGGHAEMVSGLLALKANVQAESAEGCTALTFAAECSPASSDGLKCMELLIKARADVNHRSGKTCYNVKTRKFGLENPLGNAICAQGDFEKLLMIQRAGYDMMVSNDTGIDPAWWALTTGRPDCLQTTIDAKADLLTCVDYCKSDTGFWKYLWPGPERFQSLRLVYPPPVDYGVFDILFDSGFDLNTTLEIQQFPRFTLFVMLVRDVPFLGKPELFDCMLNRGYDMNKPRYTFEATGKVYTDFQIVASICPDPATIMYLLDKKADPHFSGPDGYPFTVLMHLNPVAKIAYADWLQMQEAEHPELDNASV